MEETASFLQALLASHGPNYLEKLFGSKARDALAPLGGVNKVAIALSGECTARDSFFPNWNFHNSAAAALFSTVGRHGPVVNGFYGSLLFYVRVERPKFGGVWLYRDR